MGICGCDSDLTYTRVWCGPSLSKILDVPETVSILCIAHLQELLKSEKEESHHLLFSPQIFQLVLSGLRSQLMQFLKVNLQRQPVLHLLMLFSRIF